MNETEPAANTAGRSPGFRQELGLWSSTMLVIGSMIGSGIFIVSADIARTVGSPGYLLVVWLITGVVTLMAALSYGELAGMMPHAGGQYVYLREAYNPLVGFLYGWTLFLVIQTGTIAAVAVAFAKFTAIFFPALGENVVVLTVGGRSVSAAQMVAIASIAVLTAVNSRGLRVGKYLQNTFTLAKIAALLAIILLGIIIGRNASAVAANLSGFWTASWTHLDNGKIAAVESLGGVMLLAALGVSMVGSLFSSDAWNNITFASGEVIHPKRTVPLSLALGTLVVTLLYVSANIAYIVVLPLAGDPVAGDVLGRGIQFAASDRVATAAASVILGAPAVSIMAALVMVSTFGCNNGLILAGARVYWAMACDGLFFRRAAALNRQFVPGTALALQGVWASFLCLTGTYSDLLDYVVFTVLIFYSLTIFGIFILRRKNPTAPRPYKALGYPVLPALYILLALAICIDLLIFKPNYTWPGLLIVLAGVPVYFVWRRFAGKFPLGQPIGKE